MIDLQGGDLPLGLRLQSYMAAWSQLGISEIKPVATTLSWKVANKSGMFWNLKHLSHLVDQAHIGTVNDRYIASLVLKAPIIETVWIIKLLERRPDSQDVLGLDSIDYLVDNMEKAYQALKAHGYKVAKERNDMHEWLSLRFGPHSEFEAKFIDHIVLDVAVKELQQSTQSILGQIKSI